MGQVANLKDVPARNSQGRVFPAAPPGCLPHLLQGPDDTTFHSPEPPNQYSSKDQICLAKLGFGLPRAHLLSCRALGLLSTRVTQLLHGVP